MWVMEPPQHHHAHIRRVRISTAKTLEPIEAGANQTVDLVFTYTGEALQVYTNPTLDWTN